MPGESILTPIQRSVGVSAIKDSIYKEIEFRKETIMNEVIIENMKVQISTSDLVLQGEITQKVG